MLVGNMSTFTSKCLAGFENRVAAGNLEESILHTFAPEERFSMVQAPYVLQKIPATKFVRSKFVMRC